MSTLQEQLQKLLAEPLKEDDLQKEPLQTVLQNVQGNILHGHGRDFAAHIFLQFHVGKELEVKQWLRDHIVGKVTSAQDQLVARQAQNRDTLFVSCLLSASGYRFLGALDPTAPQQFSAEFLGGMKEATGRLQDPPYASWEQNYREEAEIHAMILLAHQDEQILGDEKKKLVDAYIQPLTVRHWVEWGNVLPRGRRRDEPRVEHFGYVESQSQPLFFQQDLDKEARERGIDLWNPGVGPYLVLTQDPLGREAMDYGSYSVFRKLQQDVGRFERQIDTLATALGVTKDEAKARVVGRFPNGKPLAPYDTSAVYPNPNNAVPNNFRYDQDVDGQLCPYHAHIRRMNPRWEAGGLRYDRRIARRGMPYGEQGSTEPVGLLFMCYQQSLKTQFEALQGQWAHKPDDSAFSKTGYDPLAGAMTGVAASPQQWPRPGGAAQGTVAVQLGDFVTLQGGEYFFTPSINVLKELLR